MENTEKSPKLSGDVKSVTVLSVAVLLASRIQEAIDAGIGVTICILASIVFICLISNYQKTSKSMIAEWFHGRKEVEKPPPATNQ